jgi:hypothetical protein
MRRSADSGSPSGVVRAGHRRRSGGDRHLPHGHAASVLSTIRAIGLDRLFGKPTDQRLAPLAIALIASRLISPSSKLATARDLTADTAGSSLGRLLGLGAVDEVELYRALDWLGARQAAVETALARRHLKEGALVLYDVSSSWVEGRCCELARFGYSRDGKKGKSGRRYCPRTLRPLPGSHRPHTTGRRQSATARNPRPVDFPAPATSSTAPRRTVPESRG